MWSPSRCLPVSILWLWLGPVACADDATGDPPGGDGVASSGDDDGAGVGLRCRVTDDCRVGLYCVSTNPCEEGGGSDPEATCGTFTCETLCAGGTDTQCADADACCSDGSACQANWCVSP